MLFELFVCSGKDATDEFNDVGHTHDAWAMLEKYCIGEIDRSTVPSKEIPRLLQKNAKKSKYTYLFQFLIPLILLNLVVAIISKSSA